MAAISSMFKQAGNSKSPSRAHAKELKAKGNGFFRLLLCNGGICEFGRKTQVLDAPTYNSFHKRNIIPLQLGMEEKGVFFKFFFGRNFGIISDIFHQSSIRGCPILFCSNTEVFPLGRGDKYPLPGGTRGMHTILKGTSYERICIFADRTASRLDDSLSLEAPQSKSGISTIDEASDYLCKSAYASAKSQCKDSLLDAALLEVLFHETGHTLLEGRSGISGENSELFAYAFSLPNAIETRICLSMICAAYAKGRRPSEHFYGSNDFLGKLSSSLGMGWANTQEQVASLIRCASVAEGEIRAAASGILGSLCTSLGVSLKNMDGQIVEPARRIIYG
jgi:hypothetical protein